MNTTESVHTMEPSAVMNELIKAGLLVKDAHDLVMKALSYWHCDPSPTRKEWQRLFRTYMPGALGRGLADRIAQED